jgi:ABC-2 type transport system permease protein
MLPLLIWAIGRGSLSVAGELERGTLDLTLSRPIRRSTYLTTQIVVGVVGLAMIAGALVAGHVVGNIVHKVPGAPSIQVWFRPWANFVALGFAIFGYTLLASSVDVVRWRATTFGAVITIFSGMAQAIAGLEVLRPYRKYIENASVFKRYNPIRVATTGEDFGFDVGVLFAIGGICVLMGLLFFSRRDLPSSAG